MAKKIAALCTLLSINAFLTGNGYSAEQGYEVPKTHHHADHPHHGHSDKITDEADERRLKALENDDASARTYTNLSRAGLAVGAGLVIIGCMAKDNNFKCMATGATTFTISAAGGYLIYQAGQGRTKERKEILERRSKHSHH